MKAHTRPRRNIRAIENLVFLRLENWPNNKKKTPDILGRIGVSETGAVVKDEKTPSLLPA
jgi:hypothetical protein